MYNIKNRGHRFPYSKVELSIDECKNFKQIIEMKNLQIEKLLNKINSVENILSQINKIGINIHTEIQPLLNNIQPLTFIEN